MLGMGTLPLIAVPHPLAGNDQALVNAKGSAISDEVVDALTGSQEAIRARYESKFLALTERRLEGGAVCIDEVCRIDPVFADSGE